MDKEALNEQSEPMSPDHDKEESTAGQDVDSYHSIRSEKRSNVSSFMSKISTSVSRIKKAIKSKMNGLGDPNLSHSAKAVQYPEETSMIKSKIKMQYETSHKDLNSTHTEKKLIIKQMNDLVISPEPNI